MALQKIIDTAIEYIVQRALDKVWSLLQNHVGILLGAENHLVKIRDSLEEIRDLIVIAEGSPKKDPKLMKLLEKLKDAANDTEDLVEEYAIENRRRSEEAENRPNKIRRVFTSFVTGTPVINSAEMLIKLKELSERLVGDTFQLKEKVTDLMIKFKKKRETHSFIHKSQAFGRDEEKGKKKEDLRRSETEIGCRELEEGDFSAMWDEEFNKRVEEFITRFNREVRLREIGLVESL